MHNKIAIEATLYMLETVSLGFGIYLFIMFLNEIVSIQETDDNRLTLHIKKVLYIGFFSSMICIVGQLFWVIDRGGTINNPQMEIYRLATQFVIQYFYCSVTRMISKVSNHFHI